MLGLLLPGAFMIEAMMEPGAGRPILLCLEPVHLPRGWSPWSTPICSLALCFPFIREHAEPCLDRGVAAFQFL